MHKLGIEIDENGHTDTWTIKETIKKVGIRLIRINPDKKDFDIDDEISEIQDSIYESGKNLGEQLEKNKIIEDLERCVKIIKLSG